jgi:hypothetical protein
MNKEKFNKLVQERILKVEKVLFDKSAEYSTDEDKLHNFNKGAYMTRKTRESVLFGFLLKHIISVTDIIENLDKQIVPSNELIDEKIGDCINYFILLEACLKERNEVND